MMKKIPTKLIKAALAYSKTTTANMDMIETDQFFVCGTFVIAKSYTTFSGKNLRYSTIEHRSQIANQLQHMIEVHPITSLENKLQTIIIPATKKFPERTCTYMENIDGAKVWIAPEIVQLFDGYTLLQESPFAPIHVIDSKKFEFVGLAMPKSPPLDWKDPDGQ